MLSRQTNRFATGQKETHYALSDGSDVSICGCDLLGYTDYEGLGPTPGRRVNCPQCLELYGAVTADYIARH
jgi:hypothetical protein